MSQFHNPYHFVPLPDGAGADTVSLAKSSDGKSHLIPVSAQHLDHGRFLPAATDQNLDGHYSGRLVCRLEVLELLAVGGAQSQGNKEHNRPREVELFQIDGERAVGGSSLRGLISSIAESACGGTLRVLHDEAISLSAGPQNRTKLGSVYAYFREAGHAERLPLRQGDGRTTLSMDEQLFGTVEILPEGKKPPHGWLALSLASRLRVAHARLVGVVDRAGEQVTQILDSPKPPAPALYFKHRKKPGTFTPKLSLSPSQHEPQGRKFYLHRKKLEKCDWVSAGRDQQHQKAKVNPLSSGVFWFHVDFFNLTRAELELLCYAIRPNPDFRHKLGMGKPLGLGKVEVRPMGLFLIDPVARYGKDSLQSPRYSLTWKAQDADWPERYATERDAASSERAAPCPTSLSADWRERVATKFRHLDPCCDALEMLGDPRRVEHPVHYPQVDGAPEGTPAFERAHFKWFVQNEKHWHQALAPLPAERLPVLNRSGMANEGKSGPAVPKQSGPPSPPTSALPGAPVSPADRCAPKPKVGDIVEARVTGHLKGKNGNYIAAFLDLGGHKGFLHASQLGQGFIEDIRSVVPKGAVVRVRVLALSAPNGKPTLQCTMKGVPQSS